MKGSDIFCASQAATSICLSMEQASSSSSSSTIQLGLGSDRAIDRYNPIIKDSKRIGKSLPPCTSQPPPISPKPRKKHHKKNLKNSSEENDEEEKKKFIKPNDQKLKSSYSDTNDNSFSIRKSWSCTRPGGFISPAGSTRYLLSDKHFLAGLSDSDPGLKLAPVEQSKLSQAMKTDELSDSKPEQSKLSQPMKTDELSDSKPPSSSTSPEQVVVLKVSLDCRGCEKKLRKHLSKMEGVTSFNIDFLARKVTVIGNVTELGVLASISKLKNAKSWSPELLDSGTSQLKNDHIGVGAS